MVLVWTENVCGHSGTQNNPIISAELFRTLSPQFHPEEQIHVAQSHEYRKKMAGIPINFKLWDWKLLSLPLKTCQS